MNKLLAALIRFAALFGRKNDGVFKVFKIKRPGRNEPCRCGSKHKYKKCCYQKDELSIKRWGRI